MNELELKARLRRGMVPGLNPTLGAEPAIACAKLEEVSNLLLLLLAAAGGAAATKKCPESTPIGCLLLLPPPLVDVQTQML